MQYNRTLASHSPAPTQPEFYWGGWEGLEDDCDTFSVVPNQSAVGASKSSVDKVLVDKLPASKESVEDTNSSSALSTSDAD